MLFMIMNINKKYSNATTLQRTSLIVLPRYFTPSFFYDLPRCHTLSSLPLSLQMDVR